MNKKCKVCGVSKDINEFEKSNSCKDGYRSTCKKCRLEKKKKYTVVCKHCGNTFITANKNTRFCSFKCIGDSKKVKVKTVCDYCGKEIYLIPSKYEKDNLHYCNQQCRTEHLKTIMKGENNPIFSKVEYKCDGCGNIILVTPYQIKSQKHIFCSKECFKNNIGEFYSGENNSNWNKNLTDEDRNDLRRYPEYYEWRDSVFKKDNYTCQCCGSSKSGTLKSHHKDGYNWCIDRRTDILNGVTLCDDCHKLFHSIYGYGNNTEQQFNEFLNNIYKKCL